VDHSLGLGDRLVHYCLYGGLGGVPIVSLGGSPSTRWKRPDIVDAIEDSGVRMLIPDRPGYGGSTRQPGRTVVDVVTDVAALADAQGWDRFAVTGGSGGGPHALACAALLGDRVTRCAVSACIMPPIVDGPEPADLKSSPTPVSRGNLAPPALADPAAMARLTATFVTSHDGWVDDNLAFATDWGFSLNAIQVPTSIWYGDQDQRSRTHANLLTAAIQGAELFAYEGGHLQPAPAYREMLGWLRGTRD
jgi:pimeloyl-ACP methyl ester carboxylesterase